VDPLDEISAAARVLEQAGFDVIAEHVRRSAEVFEAVSGEQNARGYSARRSMLYKRRDRALRQAALRWADLAPKDATRMLAGELARYYTRCWPRERRCTENPHAAGSLRGHLWAALAAVDRVPGRRQLQRIILTRANLR
jgi:hypothetical protein